MDSLRILNNISILDFSDEKSIMNLNKRSKKLSETLSDVLGFFIFLSARSRCQNSLQNKLHLQPDFYNRCHRLSLRRV